jgi:hypothetical protein
LEKGLFGEVGAHRGLEAPDSGSERDEEKKSEGDLHPAHGDTSF